MSKHEPAEKAALRRAAEVLGGQVAMADLLGYTNRGAIWPYFKPERQFPAEHCPAIEKATRERGSPVLCEELRPDIPWEVLREQVKPKRKAKAD